MYTPADDRYARMSYRRSGSSGIKLPLISLGLWHNFGAAASAASMSAIAREALDQGITHFDLANNYGPPPGAAEEHFGRILRTDFAGLRHELLISTKAGYTMWPGPYGDWGSRKHLLSSLEQSLRRLGLESVDIFYHHRPDPETPLEETMRALDQAVRSGKALYVGLSNYPAEKVHEAAAMLRSLGTPCLIHQPKYSMFQRAPETTGLLKTLALEGIGSIVFSPLAQGLLTNRYLAGIPEDSRVRTSGIFLKEEQISPETISKVARLNEIATARGQSLAQMALAWVLRRQGSVSAADGSERPIQVTSALIGASKPEQVRDCVGALARLEFTSEELSAIDAVLAS